MRRDFSSRSISRAPLHGGRAVSARGGARDRAHAPVADRPADGASPVALPEWRSPGQRSTVAHARTSGSESPSPDSLTPTSGGPRCCPAGRSDTCSRISHGTPRRCVYAWTQRRVPKSSNSTSVVWLVGPPRSMPGHLARRGRSRAMSFVGPRSSTISSDPCRRRTGLDRCARLPEAITRCRCFLFAGGARLKSTSWISESA